MLAGRAWDVRAEKSSIITVLLVGENWDTLKTPLIGLANQSEVILVGPVNTRVEEATNQSGPSVIVVGPNSDYAPENVLKEQPEGRFDYPSILLCITHDTLEQDELYADVDDLLVVPCSAAELGKRIKRLAHRNQARTRPSELRVGTITLDLCNYQATLEGRRIALAWMEFQLLKFLMQNPDRVFTREQLLTNVWGVENIGGTRTVDVHIRRLRSKLGMQGDGYFRTVKNVGYGIINPQ